MPADDEGSVWDDGPQYPDLWPAPDPADQTPTAPSPVDLDALDAAPAPAVAPPSPQPDDPRRDWWRGRFLGVATWIWLAMLAVLITVLAIIATSSGDSDPELVDTTGPNASGPAMTTPPTVRPPATVATGTLPEVATPATTEPPTQATQLPTTTPTTSPTTSPTTTTTVTTTTRPPVTDGPVVTIVGRVAPCDFGAECLIAGFTIAGFDSQPTEFVCEFGDGSRYPFRFDSGGVERACATGNADGSITIEVDGVRSETFRRP